MKGIPCSVGHKCLSKHNDEYFIDNVACHWTHKKLDASKTKSIDRQNSRKSTGTLRIDTVFERAKLQIIVEQINVARLLLNLPTHHTQAHTHNTLQLFAAIQCWIIIKECNLITYKNDIALICSFISFLSFYISLCSTFILLQLATIYLQLFESFAYLSDNRPAWCLQIHFI